MTIAIDIARCKTVCYGGIINCDKTTESTTRTGSARGITVRYVARIVTDKTAGMP